MSKGFPLARPPLRWHPHGVERVGYGDYYRKRADAEAQAKEVFLAGCALPAAWAGRQRYALIELGFGFGSNFLGTLAEWLADPKRCDRMDYCAVEGTPVALADLRRYHHDGSNPELLDALCAQWPPLVPGLHVLNFAAGRVRLLLSFGQLDSQLAEFEHEFDVAYLAGFAPRVHPDTRVDPELWSKPVLHALRARLPRAARLAAASAAGGLRSTLEQLGFAVRKVAGLAGERAHLMAHLPYGRAAQAFTEPPAEVAIVGGGIAAAACAARLRYAGIKSTLYRLECARLQPAAVVHPELWHPDDLDSQWHTAAFLSLTRALRDYGVQDQVRRVGVSQWDPDPDAGYALPELVTKDGPNGAQWHCEHAGWLIPEHLLAALWRVSEAKLVTASVARIAPSPAGWCLLDERARVLGEHASVIVATGAGPQPIVPDFSLPVHHIRGQSESLDWSGNPLDGVRCGAGYRVQLSASTALLGASFIARSSDLAPSAREQQAVRSAFAQRHGCPELMHAASLSLHTGVRASGVDRRPYVGPWPQPGLGFNARGWPRAWPGLFACLGMGSRGYSSAFLAAELLCAQIDARMAPVGRKLRLAVDPGRLLAKLRAKR